MLKSSLAQYERGVVVCLFQRPLITDVLSAYLSDISISATSFYCSIQKYKCVGTYWNLNDLRNVVKFALDRSFVPSLFYLFIIFFYGVSLEEKSLIWVRSWPRTTNCIEFYVWRCLSYIDAFFVYTNVDSAKKIAASPQEES